MADFNRSRNDDPDDFMASILNKPSQATPQQIKRPQPKPASANELPSPIKKDEKITPRTETRPNKKPRKRLKKGFKRVIVAFLVLLLLFIGAAVLWRGPISSLLEPKSPFTEEQKQGMGIPLYYPAKLPGTYKIELGSITQPESGVIMYALSDDDNNRINVTLQKKPEGISFDPLYTVLKDIRDINTKHGVVKYGTSEDGISVANVLMPETWIIINSDSGTLNDSGLITIIDSLKY